MHQRGNLVVLAAPTVLALCFVYGYALTYLGAEPTQYGIYRPRHDWLYVHIVAGSVALLLGPLQLWLGLNKRTAFSHRLIGVLYVLSVATGGIAGLYLAKHTDFGWVFGLGFGSMAVAWMTTTALATLAISLRRVEQHREWMIRSYVVTFGFVTFRVLNAIFD